MSGVLITRPQDQSASAAARLNAAGYAVFLAPVLNIVPVSGDFPELMPQAVLLSSTNAVPALSASSLPRDLPVFAVGDRTAEVASAAGFTQVESAAGDAEALLELVMQRCSNGLGALLYLTGDTVAGDLATQLGQAGYWVETRVVYSAVASTALPDEVSAALAAGEIEAVLLYSPRSAAIFSRLLDSTPLRAKLDLVCLSEGVAHGAGSGWRSVTISPKPDEHSLLQTLLQMSRIV